MRGVEEKMTSIMDKSKVKMKEVKAKVASIKERVEEDVG